MDVKVTDGTGSSKNSFWFKKQITNTTSFNFDFLINNLKVVSDEYNVSLSSKLISKWEGSDITYYIALEKTSNYGS